MSEFKENEWYFISEDSIFAEKTGTIGYLGKVLKIQDNPNYANVEEWVITKDRKFKRLDLVKEVDTVYLNRFGKKVTPPKAFQILNSSTVKQILDTDQAVDTEDDYND